MKLAEKIKVLYKLIVFGLFISSYMISSLIVLIINFFSFDRCRKFLIKNISFHSKLGLKLFNIKVTVKNSDYFKDNNYLIVSNHLSYLDILVISSVFPACFVTSVEMKKTPFLGELCLLGGCLFVERRSKKGLSDEVKNLSNALRDGLNVVIFPEATSGNGESLLRFRRPLYQSAIDSHKNVLPMCLNYRRINGESISLKNRDNVYWYGAMTFFPHFINILRFDSFEIELTVLPQINLMPEMTKVELTSQSFELINQNYQIILPDNSY